MLVSAAALPQLQSSMPAQPSPHVMRSMRLAVSRKGDATLTAHVSSSPSCS